jgi:hypothetical protein
MQAQAEHQPGQAEQHGGQVNFQEAFAIFQAVSLFRGRV